MTFHPNDAKNTHNARAVFSDVRILFPAGNQAVDASEALIGAAPPGASVLLFLDKERLLNVTADDRGQWQLHPHFAVGRHHVRASLPEGGSDFVTYTVREPF